jgi:MoaA/NifB/PqqE/SkfB family radical SAM enzyme
MLSTSPERETRGHMDTPDYRFSRPFKGKGVLSNGLKGIKNALVKRYFIFHCISTLILSRTSRRVLSPYSNPP